MSQFVNADVEFSHYKFMTCSSDHMCTYYYFNLKISLYCNVIFVYLLFIYV